MMMSNSKFTIEDVVSHGWAATKVNFWGFMGLLAIAGFVQVLPGFASFSMQFGQGDPSVVISLKTMLGLVAGIISAFMMIGLINVQLMLIDGKTASSNDLWLSNRFFPFIGATIIFGCLVGVGSLLCVIPGIVLAIMLQFYPYFIVEHRLGPIQSLKASAAITSGCLWNLFFLGIVLGIIEGIGAMLFLIGAIPAHMVKRMSMTYAYRRLLENTPLEELPFDPGTTR